MQLSFVEVRLIAETCTEQDFNKKPFSLPVLASDQTMVFVLRLADIGNNDRFKSFRRRVAWHIIGSALGYEIHQSDMDLTNHGKPIFANGKKGWFNISHCRDLLAVSVSKWADIGVDIEVPKSIEIDSLARRVIHPEDPTRFRELDGFFECWTLKEAVVKAWGMGLSRAFDAIQLSDTQKSGWLTARYDNDLSIANSLNGLLLPYGCKIALAFNISDQQNMSTNDFPEIVNI